MWVKKNKSTHTHTTVYTTNSRSIPERRTVITCVQLGDIIYSNFSNTSIKLVFVTTLPPYNSLSQNMHFFFWLFRLNGCSVLALCWAAGVVFTLRTMFDAGNTMPLYLYMHYSFSIFWFDAMHGVIFSNVVLRCLPFASPPFPISNAFLSFFSLFSQFCVWIFIRSCMCGNKVL